MKKKLTCVLLSLCLLVALVTPVLAEGGSEAENTSVSQTTEPTTTEPTTTEPTTTEPTTTEPTTTEPTTTEPTTTEPTTTEPTTTEPTTTDPTTTDPTTTDPTTTDPTTTDPTTTDPTTTDPTTTEPTTTEEPGSETDYENMDVAALFEALDAMDDEQFQAVYDALSEEKQHELDLYLLELANVDLTAPTEEENLSPAVNVTEAAPLVPPVTGEASLGEKITEGVKNAAENVKDAVSSAASAVVGFFSFNACAAEPEDDSGDLQLSKTATYNAGSNDYTIHLESYATGEVTTTTTTQAVPCDIVLVLDQSGSMAYQDFPKTETEWSCYDQDDLNYTTQDMYNIQTGYGGNGTQLYYQDGDTYYPVTIVKGSGKRLTYTYEYVDNNNELQTTARRGNTPLPYDLYYHDQYQITRLDALKEAASNFVTNVQNESKGTDGALGTSDDVDNRIAVVGFSSSGYDNTELLTGVDISTGNWRGKIPNSSSHYYFPTGYEENGVQYGDITDDQYHQALQDVTTTAGQNSIRNALNALTAYGGTQTQNGMEMAQEILEENPVAEGTTRNRVVIVFTDGVPGNSGYDATVAQQAINSGNTIKEDDGATIYTIGIFAGADATSAGDQDGWEVDQANWFMQNLSSNNGEVQTPSYYLSAGDAGSLNSIFENISEQINTGSTSVTLDSNAVLKDFISPYFDIVPDSVSAETVACTGKSGDAWQWADTGTAVDSGNITTDPENGEVDVTGFDYQNTYVTGTEVERSDGTLSNGSKLVVTFSVKPKDGFWGGNNVPTNLDTSGIYADKDATSPGWKFPVPTVDVAIPNIQMSDSETNLYCGNEAPTAETLTNWSNKPTADWQTKYVNVTSVNDDKTVSTTDDGTYGITVTVSPEGEATHIGPAVTEQTKTVTAHVNVYTPTVTYQDTTIDPEKNESADYANNLVSTVWKHGNTVSTGEGVTMAGSEPTLTFTYNPEAGAFTEEKNVSVVTVMNGSTDIKSQTNFEWKHNEAEGQCSDTEVKPDNAQFRVHVRLTSFDLTITKKGSQDDNQSFVFTVSGGPDSVSMKVTVQGNGNVKITGLKQGTYTVTEDTGWSWRYTLEKASQTVTLNQNDEVTFTNTLSKTNWLSGNSYAVNTFKESIVQKLSGGNR